MLNTRVLHRAALEPAALHADLAVAGGDRREGRKRTCCARPAHAPTPTLPATATT